ncbi:MAG: thioredoxin domain-containing protein [Euryarchaeota archaeon]|nr:thioredoxin domain-containing protein [Euryarchaeota archaeon]MDE1836159.1 thioredoxin domain-containing protein [Euryarchaeota archaeon]MDE1881014.1 thioredoxin domain-containing protein [Euryarchaeota archaeon]MDE2045478.1 thioredoxin domain-containing protein [Thermoplasmata archaeon]
MAGKTSALPAHRLSKATSAYLRSAAEQGIEWYPWGEEPFRVAKATGRPILLDIGAAWCHWCHVMDEGTYSDEEVARLVNLHFVAVKVDRDENPEVDRRYQKQVQAVSGEGGWPLTAFLTPQGETFLGGTYFPPTDGHGRPGFRSVLNEVARLWREERPQLREQAEAVSQGLRSGEERASPAGVDLSSFVEHTVSSALERYDPAHGGFGGAPKFPHPTGIELLLDFAARRSDPRASEAARLTLLHMVDGGLYDQLGGGFHRYSVDDAWHVPHFEKMAVDNAHLLTCYVAGWEAFHEPRFREVIEGTVDWVLGTLGRDPRGGFAASQDADNAPGDDGGYFTWSSRELRGLLSAEEFRAARWTFGLDGDARMPHEPSQNVLQRLFGPTEVAEHLKCSPEQAQAWTRSAIAKMRTVRSSRPEPLVDPALYASLNGLLIGALALASRALGDPRPLEAARKAADRFLREAYEPSRGVAHHLSASGAEGWGLLEDQSEFALGLLRLAEVSADGRYLESARSLLDLALQEFRPEPEGLLRDLSPRLYDGPKVGAWEAANFPLEDAPHLSANAATALALLHLSALLGEPGEDARTASLLGAMATRLRHAGLFGAGAALAAGIHLQPAVRVVVEGTGGEAEELWKAAVETYHPRKVLFRGAPRAPFVLPEEAAQASGSNTKARALLCRGTSCQPPMTTGEEVRTALREESRGS